MACHASSLDKRQRNTFSRKWHGQPPSMVPLLLSSGHLPSSAKMECLQSVNRYFYAGSHLNYGETHADEQLQRKGKGFFILVWTSNNFQIEGPMSAWNTTTNKSVSSEAWSNSYQAITESALLTHASHQNRWMVRSFKLNPKVGIIYLFSGSPHSHGLGGSDEENRK